MFFTPHWRWFAFGTVCAFATSLAAVSYGYLLQQIGDRLQSAVGQGLAGIKPWMWILPGVIILAAVIRAGFLYAMTLANNIGVQRALVDVQTAEFDHLIDGDFNRVSSAGSGALAARFVNDINILREASLRLANNTTKSVLTVLGAFSAMVWLDWALALVMGLTYPIAFRPVIGLGRRIRKRASRAQVQAGEMGAALTEGFQSARSIKAFGLELQQKARARAGFEARARLFLSVLRDKAGVDPILEVAGGIALAIILAFSTWRITLGEASIGDVLGFIGLIAVAAPELRALGTLNAAAQEGGAAADRVFAIIDASPVIADPPSPVRLPHIRGHIRFDRVDFAYSAETPVLSDISFDVFPGETVALVGPSGAGKSTIFDLILRLYDPVNGRVLLDGEDLRALALADIRQSCALVEQDPILFDKSVRANIEYGLPGTEDRAVKAAAASASAHDFITALPEGYETRVGERGRALSGGQRQRVALARALLRGGPILLLDEALSALDPETAADIQMTLFGDMRKERTTLIIAHTLETAQRADRILVLDEGRLDDTGSHTDLMARNGTYARLVESAWAVR